MTNITQTYFILNEDEIKLVAIFLAKLAGDSHHISRDPERLQKYFNVMIQENKTNYPDVDDTDIKNLCIQEMVKLIRYN